MDHGGARQRPNISRGLFETLKLIRNVLVISEKAARLDDRRRDMISVT
jgi:alpha-D-ribose 1-methylphosphonate 5-triphosphate synthase subunit PhnL